MGAVESSVPMAQKIQSEGIGGVWEQLKAKVGDLKATLLGKIAQYLIPTVIIAGITWIVSLLNPASAFIKACKAIIDIVMFIVERGAQIMTFVNAVLDAVIVIAGGGAGGVPGLIETALATALPVLIGFLAALLGIGGLADKVKKLFQSLSKPVMTAVDWIVSKIAALAKKLWAKMKGNRGKGKDGRDGKPLDKQKQLDHAMAEASRALSTFEGKTVGEAVLNARLAPIQSRHGLASLRVEESGSTWELIGEINPKKSKKKTIKPPPQKFTINIAELEMFGLAHTMSRHIRRDDEQLRKRLQNEPDVEAASTYTNEMSANRAIQAVIDTNQDAIENWLNNSQAIGYPAMRVKLGSVTGRAITRAKWSKLGIAATSEPTYGAFVLIRREPKARNGFIIVTSFPEP